MPYKMFVSNWTFANLIKLRSINNTLFFVILVFIVCYINEATIFLGNNYFSTLLSRIAFEKPRGFFRISVLFISNWIVLQRPIRCYYAVSNFLLLQQRRKVNIHVIITRFLSITFHQQLSLCLLNNDCQLTIVITNNIFIEDGTKFTAIFSLNLQSKYLPLSLSIADGW